MKDWQPNPVKSAARFARSAFWSARRSRVNRILGCESSCDTSSADEHFDALLPSTPTRKIDYGYEPIDLWKRGMERCNRLLSIEGLTTPGKQVLDMGCGDGMTGALLATFGHSVKLLDMEDWRCEAARSVDFVLGTIDSDSLPFSSESFDLIFSHNVVEHVRNPEVCIRNAISMLKPGGALHIAANPLYCSAWGYHAYRVIPVPYCHFLFSKELLDRRIQEIGVRDLGRQLDEPQDLNGWRWRQFEELFMKKSGLECRSLSLQKDFSSIDWVLRWPESFHGRQLTIDDISISGFSITLKKKQN